MFTQIYCNNKPPPNHAKISKKCFKKWLWNVYKENMLSTPDTDVEKVRSPSYTTYESS
jgi:hypothetical protein